MGILFLEVQLVFYCVNVLLAPGVGQLGWLGILPSPEGSPFAVVTPHLPVGLNSYAKMSCLGPPEVLFSPLVSPLEVGLGAPGATPCLSPVFGFLRLGCGKQAF